MCYLSVQKIEGANWISTSSWASLYSLYTNEKKSWIHLSVNSSCQGWIPTVRPQAMFKSKRVEVSWACKVIHLKRLLVINLQLGICFGRLGATKEEYLPRLKTQIWVDLHLKWLVKPGRDDSSGSFTSWAGLSSLDSCKWSLSNTQFQKNVCVPFVLSSYN